MPFINIDHLENMAAKVADSIVVIIGGNGARGCHWWLQIVFSRVWNFARNKMPAILSNA
jgi:hypothetical protein